jgi:hypothetical protein
VPESLTPENAYLAIVMPESDIAIWKLGYNRASSNLIIFLVIITGINPDVLQEITHKK